MGINGNYVNQIGRVNEKEILAGYSYEVTQLKQIYNSRFQLPGCIRENETVLHINHDNGAIFNPEINGSGSAFILPSICSSPLQFR